MFWLGALLPVCFIPGVTGASLPTQWAFLSLALLPALWMRAEPTSAHWAGLAFVAYAAAGALFRLPESVPGLWFIAITALAFWLGSAAQSLSALFRGLAVGLAVASCFGLLFNNSVQGIAVALVMLALVCDRAWLFLPLLVPGLYFAGSRGGWLVLATGLLGKFCGWRWVVGAIIVVGYAAVTFLNPSDSERIQIWLVAARNLTVFGHGAGSFADMLFWGQTFLMRPEHVHNDYLQVAFEFGIGAAPLLYVYAAGLGNSGAQYWPVFVGFAVGGLFFFPLYSPVLAFIGAVAAGHILRRDDLCVVPVDRRRPDFVARFPDLKRPALCPRLTPVAASGASAPENTGHGDATGKA